MSKEQTDRDRAEWAAEIRDAKRAMTKTEFLEWLNRRCNSVGTERPIIGEGRRT